MHLDVRFCENDKFPARMQDEDAFLVGLKDKVQITGDKTFVFSQAVATTVWEITHNLNKYPSVSVVDPNQCILFGDVEYLDKNSVVIRFSAATSGQAFLN